MEKVIMNTIKMESSVADSSFFKENAAVWDLIEKYMKPSYEY